MTVLVILCLISCLIGLYRIQKSAFSDYASRHSSRQDAKHDLKNVAKFIAYALPFFLLLFLFFPRLPPLWHVPIPDAKGVTGISDTMSPGDIAELSQSSALAFRIVGNMQQLPPRSKLYWRAMVLDQYDGRTWTSNFSNQQPVQAAQLQPEQVDFQYQYIAADPRAQWIMALEKSVPNQHGPMYYAVIGVWCHSVKMVGFNPLLCSGLGNPHVFKGMMHRTSVIDALASV